MKICPKCKTEHSKNGMFCSRKCANSRVFSNETRDKKSIANKKWYRNATPEERDRNTPEIKLKRKNTFMRKLSIRDFDDLSFTSKRKLLKSECDNTCSNCKLSQWCEQQICLEIDHIDGDTQNNKRENLRVLCPNCHSQTPTWRIGWKRAPLDDNEIILAFNKSSNMSDLLNLLNLKWNSYVALAKKIRKIKFIINLILAEC